MCAALLWWQLPAVPVLPLWLVVGFGIWGGGAAGFFVLMIGSVALFVVLAVVAVLTRLRPGVREKRRLGGLDALLGVAFHVAIVGLGFFGTTGVAFAIAAVLLGLGTLWLTIAGVGREWRERLSGRRQRRRTTAESMSPRVGHERPGPGDGDVIVVHEAGH